MASYELSTTGTMPPEPGSTFDIRPTAAGRARAFGLAVLYLALFALMTAALLYGSAALGLAPLHSETPFQKFLHECAAVAATVLAVAVLGRLTREPIARFGFAVTGAGRDSLIGLAAGFVSVAGTLGAIAALGGCAAGGLVLAPGWLYLAAYYALLDFGVAVFEEGVCRSFMLVQLSRAFGFWPAAILTSALFALAHAGNASEAPFGLLMAGVAGLVLAYSFRRSGTLWFAIGWHLAYDYVEDFIFGVPDSGHPQEDALLHTVLNGPNWLTGGAVGPEASVVSLAMPLALVLVLVIRFALPRRVV